MPRKILVFAANPIGTSQVRWDEELRLIKKALEEASGLDKFELIFNFATRPDDLLNEMLKHKPEIIHFIGHGTGEQGIVLQDESGYIQMLTGDALANLLRLISSEDTVKCVVLNACYTEAQADIIVSYIDYVIGTHQAIGDQSACKFSKGFYTSIAAGHSIKKAFEFGKNAIQLNSHLDYLVPVLKDKSNSYTQSPPPTLEIPESPVDLKSCFYIERPRVESECYSAISQSRALIRIKAPRKMGKTSLIDRIIEKAKSQGDQIATFSFQEVDSKFFNNSEVFLKWFCATLADKLSISDDTEIPWNPLLGSKLNCTNFLERHLLPKIDESLVIILDDVDQIFPYLELAESFLSLLRVWHEKKENPIWQKLKLVLAHSRENYVPLEINQSPFNVGLSIELSTFNLAQITYLVHLHGLKSDECISTIMKMTGGHPYFARIALYELAQGWSTIEEFREVAATDAGPYRDHLRRHLLALEESKPLKQAMIKVIIATTPVKIGTNEKFQLHSMGLVKFKGHKVEPLCDLYRLYFSECLEDNQ